MSEQNKKIHKKVNKKPNKAGSLVVAIFMALFVIVAAVVGLIVFSRPDISGKREESDYVDYHTDDDGNKYVTSTNENGDVIKVELDKVAKDNHYNFLVIGKDRAYFNTDVIMLVSFDTDTGAVSMMQIPRDTYIELIDDTRRVKKANSLLAHFYNEVRTGVYKKDLVAGLELLKKSFSEVFGVPIDYYVMLDLNGFVNIVDAIGGVELYVPMDMKYNDPEQNLYIDLKKGQQTLDGDKAEQFIRFRKGYVNADLGRVDAQKIFMRAFIEKIQKSFNVNTIVSIAEQLSKYVVTDLDVTEILFFAKSALSVDSEKVVMATLPGDLAGAYYVASRSGTYEAINSYFNPYNTSIKESKFDPNGSFYDKEGTKIYAVYSGDDELLEYYNSKDIWIPQVVTTATNAVETTDILDESVEVTAQSGNVHTGTEEIPDETSDPVTELIDVTETAEETTVEITAETTGDAEETGIPAETTAVVTTAEETSVPAETTEEPVETTSESEQVNVITDETLSETTDVIVTVTEE